MCKLKKYLRLKRKDKTTNEVHCIVRDEDIDFKKYQSLKQEGKTPVEVYSAAHTDGYNDLSCFKILCEVCNTSLREAKEVMAQYHYDCKSLNEYQEKYILPALKNSFEQEDRDSKPKGDISTKK